MQAIVVHRFGGPEELKPEEVADPTPGPGEVRVKVHAAGVNPVEAYVRAGNYGPKSFPYTPGTDAAGVVDAVGDGVVSHTAGERVYVNAANGSYAQMLVCKANQAHWLPDRLSFEEGAGIGVPFATAYRAIFIRGNAKPNETVLIHGASGGVGTAAVQLCRNAGLLVFGTAGSAAGLQLVGSLGGAALNHHDPGYLDRLKERTYGRGVDLIIEMLSDVNLNKDLGVLAKHGRVVVVGNRGPVQIEPRQMMTHDSDIRGMSLMHSDQTELALIHAALGAGLANGTLTPVVGKTLPFAEASTAHEAIMKGGTNGKIILTME